jgi:hypothetical protein
VVEAAQKTMSSAVARRDDRAVPLIAAAVVVLVHLVGNAHYGFFRDELYFIVCGFHPQWGYVDQPPVVPLLAAATQLGGHSLFLLRAVPALFAGAGVYVTCRLAAEFGGGRFAQAFAAIIFLFTAVLVSFGDKVSPDEVGLWAWPYLALLAVRIAMGADRRLWLLAGAVAGAALESKYSVLFFLAALCAGLLATSQRRVLDRWFAAGCGVAALIALPNFLWQWHYGFPMLELLRNGQNEKNLIAGPVLYLVQQVTITTLFLAPVWVVGLVWLLRAAPFRFVGIAYVILIVEMLVFHGKHYYPANVYPILIAAGAVPIEGWTQGRRIVRGALVAYALVFGSLVLPFVLPILPEGRFVDYERTIGKIFIAQRATLATEHNRESSALPGDWADMHGWPELAQAVKGVFDGLPPAERARAVVLTRNYGEASAIEFLTPDVPVISVHNQFWLWGDKDFDGNALIQIGGSCFAADHLFVSRAVVETLHPKWAIGEEQDLPIAICRGLRKPMAPIWADSKVYI